MRKRNFLLMTALLLSTGLTALAQEKDNASRYHDGLPVINQNIEWQRDVYRELDLRHNSNAGLMLMNEGENLITRVFSAVLSGKVKAYEFALSGNESFSPRAEIDIRDILSDYHIEYDTRATQLNIDNVAIPFNEVKSYYIKENVMYDRVNSRFRTIVDAICPVINREDDFSDATVKYPMFWVKIKDLTPYIVDLEIYPSEKNMASKMSVTDYFKLNLYAGLIYKVFTPSGITLNQYCDSEEAMAAERARIEEELKNIRANSYNTFRKEVKTEKKTERKALFHRNTNTNK